MKKKRKEKQNSWKLKLQKKKKKLRKNDWNINLRK